MNDDWVTTTTLLAHLSDHSDGAAWRRLVDRFHEPVRRFAERTGVQSHDADDIAQEAILEFASAYRDGRYDRTKGRLSRWLFGIAWNHVLRYRQSAARLNAKVVSGMGTDFWHDVADQNNAENVWEREWEEAVLRRCMQRVRSEFAPDIVQAFEAAVADARPAAEVAAELHLSVKAIYNAKHRVLTRIRTLRAEIEEID